MSIFSVQYCYKIISALRLIKYSVINTLDVPISSDNLCLKVLCSYNTTNSLIGSLHSRGTFSGQKTVRKRIYFLQVFQDSGFARFQRLPYSKLIGTPVRHNDSSYLLHVKPACCLSAYLRLCLNISGTSFGRH